MTEVDANLQIEETGGATRQLNEADLKQGTNAALDAQVPTALTADEEFTAPDWVEVADLGHYLILIAGTEDFDTVEIEWSDDGSTANGSTTALGETLGVESGPLTYNVYLTINNLVLPSGTHFRVHIVNGSTDQGATFVALASQGRHPYFPLIGVTDDISFLSEALLTRSIVAGQQPDGDLVNVRGDGVALTETNALGAASAFESDWIDTDGWASAELFVAADQVSATNGIEIEFTDDTDSPTVRGTRLHTFSATDAARGFAAFRFPAELDGLRVRYTNGGTPQGSFFAALTLRTTAVNPQGSYEAQLGATNVAVMVRAVLAAANDAGTYANITSGDNGGVRVSVNEQEAEFQQKSLSTVDSGSVNAGTGSASQLDTSKLTDRKYVTIGNAGSKTVYYRPNAPAMTVGVPVPPDSAVQEEWDEGIDIWVISSSGTQPVWIVQTGGTV